jgi:hypothetical protein
VKIPFAISGRARPRNIASRFAGVAISGERVWVHRSPPIVIAIPKTPAIAERWIAFPVTKNSSFCSCAKRPT